MLPACSLQAKASPTLTAAGAFPTVAEAVAEGAFKPEDATSTSNKNLPGHYEFGSLETSVKEVWSQDAVPFPKGCYIALNGDFKGKSCARFQDREHAGYHFGCDSSHLFQGFCL